VARFLDAFQIFGISGVSQRVEIDDFKIRSLFQNHPDESRADESGAARNENSFHKSIFYEKSEKVKR